MDCLSPEQLVSYVRGGGADPRGVEAHVRDCPACGMELLLVRETLGEGRAKGVRPATDRFRTLPRQRPIVWIPWAAAAAVLVGALLFAVMSQKPPATPHIVKQPDVKPKPPKPPTPEPPKTAPEEPRKPIVPVPPPGPPKPEPRPAPKPEPPPVKPPDPVKPAPAPKPEPRKTPAPTLVEKAVVARVIHSVGGPATNVGRVIRAGEALVTARQEFLHLQVEGYGRLYVRENTQGEIGASGDILLHDGEMLAKLDPGKKLAGIRTPAGMVDVQAPLVNVLATKTFTEASILSGRVIMATTSATGPSTVLAKAGKVPEIRPLEPGFASWLPDKIVAKKFSGWFEAEEFPTLQGFKVMPSDAASGGKFAVQAAEAGGIAYKGGLPFKGRHAVWLRVRQHEAKSTMIAIHLGGQSAGEVKLEGGEGKPWRWVGPLVINSDKLDLAVTALSRFPLRENDERRSFPVIVDLVLVTTDTKGAPPEKVGDETRGLDLGLDEPQK